MVVRARQPPPLRRADPGPAAVRDLPGHDQHRRHHQQRIAGEVVDRQAERHHHQHQRRELQPGLSARAVSRWIDQCRSPIFRRDRLTTFLPRCCCERRSRDSDALATLPNLESRCNLLRRNFYAPGPSPLRGRARERSPKVGLPPAPRMIFVVHGCDVRGPAVGEGDAWHGEGELMVEPGPAGVTWWRFELCRPMRANGRWAASPRARSSRPRSRRCHGRASVARRQRRVSARRLRLSASAPGAGHPLPDRRRHPHRHARPFDQLRAGRRLVRERTRSGVCAGRRRPAEPLHPRDDPAARAYSARARFSSSTTRTRASRASQQYKIFADMPIAFRPRE